MVHLDSKNENDNNDDITITKPVMTIKVIIMRVIVRRYSEAVAQRCSVKNVFLEISQNSQENTCARVSFLIKLQT